MASKQVTDVTLEQARMLAAWLDTLDPDLEGAAIALVEAVEREWQAVIEGLPRPLGGDAVSGVVRRAHELLGREPRVAQSLARLALRLSQHLAASRSFDAQLIQGDAWRECAAAHLEMSEYVDAYEAIGKAKTCYSLSNSARMNAAILALLEGRALLSLGRRDEALEAIEGASRVLLDSKADRKKYVQARTMYAVVLLDMGRYDEALDVFTATGNLARQAGDKETLAYILWNVGICAARTGDTVRGKRCLDSALRYFERLGLASEVPHVRKELVAILKIQGRFNEAISELFKIRAEFLALGIPVAAALAALSIVEVLLLSGRSTDVPSLCEEMVETFRAARLQRNLLLALAYLDSVGRERKLAREDVTYVSAFIETAQNDPQHNFIEPS
jgi:tetratricopeptide (TPR) repeat protein